MTNFHGDESILLQSGSNKPLASAQETRPDDAAPVKFILLFALAVRLGKSFYLCLLTGLLLSSQALLLSAHAVLDLLLCLQALLPVQFGSLLFLSLQDCAVSKRSL